jgi:hypothetical protein
MNDSVLTHLKIIVERAVRPLADLSATFISVTAN